MTPKQTEALEALAEWMQQQSDAASLLAQRDNSSHQRLIARGRASAHRTCCLRLRGVIVGLS